MSNLEKVIQFLRYRADLWRDLKNSNHLDVLRLKSTESFSWDDVCDTCHDDYNRIADMIEKEWNK